MFCGSRSTTVARRGDHVLGAQPLGGGEGRRRRVRVEDELDDARAVAQVDEDQPAVVAAAVDPAGDADRRARRRAARRSPPRRRGSRWRAVAASSDVPSRAGRGRRSRRAPAPPARRSPCPSSTVPSSSPKIGNVAGAGPVGLLELALARAPGELQLRVRARRARASAASANAATRRCPADVEVARPASGAGAWSPASSIRSTPAAQPMPGVGGAAEQLDQPVVAPAAADARLRAERVGGELEERARVVVEAAHERRVDLVGDAGGVQERADLGEVLGVLGGRGGRAAAARRSITSRVPGWSASKARSGLRSMRARTSSDSSSSWARR